ncbi:MAG: hypothetical protein RSA86_03175 [Christensenellaceae bacterium]
MDHAELLQQVVYLMQEQTYIIGEMIDAKIHDAEERINIKIGNDVKKRIESLFDDYKMVHEKQVEMESRIEKIEQKIDLEG